MNGKLVAPGSKILFNSSNQKSFSNCFHIIRYSFFFLRGQVFSLFTAKFMLKLPSRNDGPNTYREPSLRDTMMIMILIDLT